MSILRRLSPILNTMSTRNIETKIDDYEGFKDVLLKAKNIVALTGAGVSAESGIPTFRGAGGLWRTYKCANLATLHAFQVNPALVWEFYHYRRNVAFGAKPNHAHKALATYEKICREQGRKLTVITQNVDGLHKRAGSEDVVELHGALHKVICTKCKTIAENFDNPICDALSGRGADDNLPIIAQKDLPKCKKCQELVRPYIVWFGENLDDDVMKTSKELIEECNLCLVIGTSSEVYPAAMFAPLVVGRGQTAAEFNLNPNPAEGSFQFHFPGKCGSTLPKALGVTLQ